MLPVVRDHLLNLDRRRNNLNLIRRRAALRENNDPFELPNERFVELFRLNKRLVRTLIARVTPHLPARQSLRGISVETKVFCALRFYATGSYQRCVGEEYTSGLSQTSVHRCIASVTHVLSNIAEEEITLPSTLQERNAIKLEFMNRWQFPGVIGAIDCTHIAILKPSIDEHNYINRKGYHSINCQVICDHKLKIRSLFANFGGSTHDSYIWRFSQAQNYIRTLHNNNERCWFLGDSGYPLQQYLMTPFRNPQNPAEQRFNNAHIQGRNCIERCFGLLKSRFRCLMKERSQRYSPETVTGIIKACALLHNMCVEENLEWEEIYDFDEENQENQQNRPNVLDQNGLQTRQQIVNRYFL